MGRLNEFLDALASAENVKARANIFMVLMDV